MAGIWLACSHIGLPKIPRISETDIVCASSYSIIKGVWVYCTAFHKSTNTVHDIIDNAHMNVCSSKATMPKPLPMHLRASPKTITSRGTLTNHPKKQREIMIDDTVPDLQNGWQLIHVNHGQDRSVMINKWLVNYHFLQVITFREGLWTRKNLPQARSHKISRGLWSSRGISTRDHPLEHRHCGTPTCETMICANVGVANLHVAKAPGSRAPPG